MLYLIRGLPGSGKSTYAREMVMPSLSRPIHLEADMFFMNNGKYEFNPTLIKTAHQWCFDSAKIFLNNKFDVVVSNTFTQLWEMQRYIDLAKELTCELVVVRMLNNFGNIHDVPEDKLIQMKERFEDFEGEWLEKELHDV